MEESKTNLYYPLPLHKALSFFNFYIAYRIIDTKILKRNFCGLAI